MSDVKRKQWTPTEVEVLQKVIDKAVRNPEDIAGAARDLAESDVLIRTQNQIYQKMRELYGLRSRKKRKKEEGNKLPDAPVVGEIADFLQEHINRIDSCTADLIAECSSLREAAAELRQLEQWAVQTLALKSKTSRYVVDERGVVHMLPDNGNSE